MLVGDERILRAVADADRGEAAAPIHVEERVCLAARVVVRSGAKIAAGAVIAAGSVVDLPAEAGAS